MAKANLGVRLLVKNLHKESEPKKNRDKAENLIEPSDMRGRTRKGVGVWWRYARIYSLQYEFDLFLGISVTIVGSLFLMASKNYRH